ncbi:hypothetical protein HN51_033212 [Arachis hypogaea]|uniref:SMP-30/Gluconolactonase/LRE-like region domain-containing protein n=1 Tax=Arachis hypogaea TaxID=3818 RepID=A0A445B1T8_ARAHY|nr:uncharacterized protein LOC112716839 [Arachis hypogaea]QHO17685.1 uncharacterized protein DS421_10g314240 [Arachis hypogaea]RYR32606.1 hypothetical protein Ahy_A10g047140 [Arachis hypogaea]
MLPWILFFLLATVEISTALVAGNSQVITFRSPKLFPEGLAWDPTGQNFLVGSLHHRTISNVSNAGVIETLISDTSLPENVTILGLAVDSRNHRVLAALHAFKPLPPFNALAAYDLHSGNRLFLTVLPTNDNSDESTTANDVAVDFKGNAYVTNSGGNYIWKVNEKGEASILSNSRRFTEQPVDREAWYSLCGLNGIAYVSSGYLLAVQSNTGKMFKVDPEDGTAKLVALNEDLIGADGVVSRSDGVVLVVSPVTGKLWFLKSKDEWGEGVVFDKIDLDLEGFPTSVAVGQRDRAYVLYGHVKEGIWGNAERESFEIEEVRSLSEVEGVNVYWMYVIVGVGLAYFLYWRLQMGHFVNTMDKKTN